jgi:hypothetical protein
VFLAAHRWELFDDSFTADLFGSVLVLKELYGLVERRTADAVMFDIRWKVACGLSPAATSFDSTTLVCRRRRIEASDRPDRGSTRLRR